MSAQLALLICGVFIAGLFFLDRDNSVRTSKALWLPVMWLWLVGSRPVSSWFGGDNYTLAAAAEGSPMDAAIYQALILAGIIVLLRRKTKTNALLKANAPILIYFLYCLMSTAWSPFHEPSFKRWIKAVGDLVMALVVVTDPQPIAALRRIFSRVGFILWPLSIVLIRWTDIGRIYDPSGGPMNTGVTTNKNTLGLILYVISIGAVWNVRALLIDKKAPNRTRRLIAQGALLAFGIVLLQMAHSTTSIFCFVVGAGLMLATNLRVIRKRPNGVHVLCFGMLLLGAAGMLFGGGEVASSMGKTSDFSGRAPIWAAAIASADNPLIGTGFESFWNANGHKVARILWYYYSGFVDNLNSAHDGYLQIYLDLGWVGLSLLSIIIITGYKRSVKAFHRNRELGGLILAYIVTCLFYNITEAGFRILTPTWIFLLLSVLCATGVNMGLVSIDEGRIRASGASKVKKTLGIGGPVKVEHVVRAIERSAKFT